MAKNTMAWVSLLCLIWFMIKVLLVMNATSVRYQLLYRIDSKGRSRFRKKVLKKIEYLQTYFLKPMPFKFKQFLSSI